MGISWGMGIRETPARREIPKSREFPGNSHMGNSQEEKVSSHTGGREQKFPVEYPWLGSV